MSQIEDLEAIDRYMTTANANNPAAMTVKLNWKKFYGDLSFFDKSSDDDVMAKARRLRDDFNEANTTNTGITSQKMLLIKQGSTGPNVVEWQKIIGVSADGKFGPGTKAKTIEWQKAHGLTADGIVGQQTWTKALEKNVFETVSNQIKPTSEVPVTPPKSISTQQIAQPTPQPSNTAIKSPVIKQGSTGQTVADWQKKIGATPDGNFGPDTKAKTIEWQKTHGLNPDGIVGPATLAASAVVPNAAQPTSVNQAVNAATAAIKGTPDTVIKGIKKLPLWLQITMSTMAAGLAFLGFKELTKK